MRPCGRALLPTATVDLCPLSVPSPSSPFEHPSSTRAFPGITSRRRRRRTARTPSSTPCGRAPRRLQPIPVVDHRALPLHGLVFTCRHLPIYVVDHKALPRTHQPADSRPSRRRTTPQWRLSDDLDSRCRSCEHFAGYDQQDAHEFLIASLAAMSARTLGNAPAAPAFKRRRLYDGGK